MKIKHRIKTLESKIPHSEYRVLYQESKKWQHDQKRLLKKSNQLSRLVLELKATLICSICMELASIPQILACGHSYCFECMKCWLKKSNVCPTCRQEICQSPTFNLSMDSQIQILHKALDPSRACLREQEFRIFKDQRDSIWKELLAPYAIQTPIFDPEDHVHRCRNCFWEIETAETPCPHCHLVSFESPQGSSDEEDDVSIEYPH